MKKLRLRLSEVSMLCMYLFAYLLSCFWKKRDIWLLCERGREARDNAFFFFVWLKKNHPEIEAYYIADKNHPDYEKLAEYRDWIIQYKSLRHYIMACRATMLISTHIMGYTNMPTFFANMDRKIKLFPRAKRVFLQHGIIKDLLPTLFANKVRLDLFVCGGKIEHEYICKEFGYTDAVAKYTGLCRYDNLMDNDVKRQVLIMPTWRMYIDKNRFEETSYFHAYKALLESARLKELLERYGYTAVFYPHHEVQPFIHLFRNLSIPDYIEIAGFERDVQTLLKESACLVTDYSSVYFDVSYMRKPILLYQFDQEEFHAHHYQRGYLDVSELGEVSDSLNGLLLSLERTLERDCTQLPHAAEFCERMFRYCDKKNCERVYESIVWLDSRRGE